MNTELPPFKNEEHNSASTLDRDITPLSYPLSVRQSLVSRSYNLGVVSGCICSLAWSTHVQIIGLIKNSQIPICFSQSL